MNFAISFSHPWLVSLALLPVGFFLLFWLRNNRKKASVSFPTYQCLPASQRYRLLNYRTAVFLRLLAAFCLVPVIAGIASRSPIEQARKESAVWIIVLDVSSSMTAEDFQPQNRLEAAKRELKEFVAANREAEIGLVVFAASARLLVPLTPDHAALAKVLDGISSAEFGEDGTAIGSGVASAINRLRHGAWPARRILLITDGVSNRGAISPLDGARLARSLGISIHALGMGTGAVSRYWVPSPTGTTVELRARIEIDEQALEELAQESQGTYQRVTNSEELRRALFSLSDKSQTPVSIASPGENLRWVEILAWGALLFLLVEFLLLQLLLSELPV